MRTSRLSSSLSSSLSKIGCAAVLACLAAASVHAEAVAKKPTKKPAPIYDTEINGSLELQSKAQICYKSDRSMLVNFGTNDCSACRVVNQAFTEPKFYEAFTKQYVPVSIDVSPGSPNREILKNLNLDPAKGLPILVIFDNQNRFVEASKPGEMVRAAKKGPDEVRAWIYARFKKNEE